MKKNIQGALWGIALAICVAAGVLAGCSAQSAAQNLTPEQRTQLYTEAIEQTGSSMLEANRPVASAEDPSASLLLDMLGVPAEDMQAFSISLSPMNIKAYAIALILPAEGKEQAVLDAVNGFVETQQRNFEQYLPDQYAIAQNAQVKTLDDGTILLVMDENAEQAVSRIEQYLQNPQGAGPDGAASSETPGSSGAESGRIPLS